MTILNDNFYLLGLRLSPRTRLLRHDGRTRDGAVRRRRARKSLLVVVEF